eukprot:3891048-Rhodomonas_salina.8
MHRRAGAWANTWPRAQSSCVPFRTAGNAMLHVSTDHRVARTWGQTVSVSKERASVKEVTCTGGAIRDLSTGHRRASAYADRVHTASRHDKARRPSTNIACFSTGHSSETA